MGFGNSIMLMPALVLVFGPGAAMGAKTLLTLSPGVVEMAMGIFFIAMIRVRRWMARASG